MSLASQYAQRMADATVTMTAAEADAPPAFTRDTGSASVTTDGRCELSVPFLVLSAGDALALGSWLNTTFGP